jgi:hypothetical protein
MYAAPVDIALSGTSTGEVRVVASREIPYSQLVGDGIRDGFSKTDAKVDDDG